MTSPLIAMKFARRLATALFLVVMLAAPAFADLAAFNAAVKAGDYRTASAAAAQAWPTLDKSRPDIAIVAREFAWASMLAGDPRGAQTYSGFLVAAPPASLPEEYVPEVGPVLDAWAKFAANNTRESRAALAAALANRAQVHATDLISVRAVQALFYDNWDKGRWKEAAAAGAAGAFILQDFGKGLADTAYNLEMGAVAAAFADKPTADLAQRMRDVAERALKDTLATTDAPTKERLTRVYFNADAWAQVTARYMQLQDKRFAPAPKSDMARRAFNLLSPAPGDPALPECAITREASTKTPKYPTGPLFDGWPGFATYRLTLAPDGRFNEIQLMGAAPQSEFAQSVDRVIDDWRWTYRDAVRPPQCRMPQYYFLEFEFRLGG